MTDVNVPVDFGGADIRMGNGRTRIAEVLWSGNGGGAERTVLDLATRMDLTRYDPTFVFLTKGGWLARDLDRLGLPWTELNWQSGYTITGRFNLVRVVSAVAPHLIHDHGLPPLTRRLLRCSNPRAGFVATEHGLVRRYMANQRYTRWLAGFDMRSADQVITHSDYMANLVKTVYGVTSSRLCRIYLGVDLEKFDPRSPACVATFEIESGTENLFKIGYVGRIDNKAKGVDIVPQIATNLVRLGVLDFLVLVAGEGPDRAALELTVRELNLAHKIELTGWQASVPSFLTRLDLMVVPSRFEAFGLAVVEALAMGVRVAAFNVGGIKEIASKCTDVFLAPAGDTLALTQAVVDLKSRFGRSRSLTSRSDMKRHFDTRGTASQIQQIYENVLSTGRASSMENRMS